MGFTTLGLSDQILQGVQATGYSVPTAIQKLTIVPAVEGNDIIGCAQTGTGKTAAFVLPMLHRLMHSNGHGSRFPRALVLTPTRELALQVQEAVAVYGRFLPLRSGTIYGGAGMEPQIKMLRSGLDVVIATPGRLLDHMKRKTIDLSRVQILVLDEADKMLDMGFIHDVRRIVSAVPKDRQTMLFSATFSPEIRSLAGGILRNPHHAEAGERRSAAETITQYFFSIHPHHKMGLLNHVLEAEQMDSVLVFTRTKHGADKIARKLERKGITSAAIHSNRSQPQRQKALEGFRQGRFRVLVATDIAARGIDVDGISHVINYDMPRDPEDYIHRIGRTGRAGSEGDAMTFVVGEDKAMVKRIERYTGRTFHIESYAGFVPLPKEDPIIRETAAGTKPGISARSFHTKRRGSGNKNRRRGGFGRNRNSQGKTAFPQGHSGSWSNY